jgi:hypothetical protein
MSGFRPEPYSRRGYVNEATGENTGMKIELRLWSGD